MKLNKCLWFLVLFLMVATTVIAAGESFDTAIPVEYEKRYKHVAEGENLKVYYTLNLKPGEGIDVAVFPGLGLDYEFLDQDRKTFDRSHFISRDTNIYESLSTDFKPDQIYLTFYLRELYKNFEFKVKKYTLYDAGIKGDAPSTFDGAVPLQTGRYENSNPGANKPNARITGNDKADMYKISVKKNQKLVVKLTPNEEYVGDVQIFDSNRRPANYVNFLPVPGEINIEEYNTYEDQDLFIKVTGDRGLDYILDISFEEADPREEAPPAAVQKEQRKTTQPPTLPRTTGSIQSSGTGALAFFASIFVFLVIASLVAYVYFAFALMTLAKKMKMKNAWMAWVPIANVYLMSQMAQLPVWTVVAFLLGGILPFVPTAIMAWYWWKIAELRHKPTWWGILMVIPPINFVIIGILAWGKE
jgi:hypothetical protein